MLSLDGLRTVEYWCGSGVKGGQAQGPSDCGSLPHYQSLTAGEQGDWALTKESDANNHKRDFSRNKVEDGIGGSSSMSEPHRFWGRIDSDRRQKEN